MSRRHLDRPLRRRWPNLHLPNDLTTRLLQAVDNDDDAQVHDCRHLGLPVQSRFHGDVVDGRSHGARLHLLGGPPGQQAQAEAGGAQTGQEGGTDEER